MSMVPPTELVLIRAGFSGGSESRKDWSHGKSLQSELLFARDTHKGRANGARQSGQLQESVGSDQGHCFQDRLWPGHVAALCATGGNRYGSPGCRDVGGVRQDQVTGTRGAGTSGGQLNSDEYICVFRSGGARSPAETMIGFIDDHRAEYAVEPICQVRPIAPSTFYEHLAIAGDLDRASDRAKRMGFCSARRKASRIRTSRSMGCARCGNRCAGRALTRPAAQWYG